MFRRHCALAAALLLPAAATGAAGEAPAVERMHPSGIVILEGDEAKTPDALPEGLAVTLSDAMRLSEQNADDFGYPWADRALGLVVLTPRTFKGDLLAERLLSRLPEPAQADVNRWASAGRHTRRYLEQVMDEVIGVQPERLVVQASYPDPEHDRIVAEVTKLDGDFLYRAAARWDPTALAVRLVDEVASGPGYRNNDTSPFKGGANYTNWVAHNGCTTGFSWHSGSTQMMLSAGHCFPTGGPAETPAQYMGWVTNGSEESWNEDIGTVLMTGQSTHRGDIALIRLTSGASSQGAMYRGGTGESSWAGHVVQMWSRSPLYNDQYCTGGAYSGELCGWVVKWSAPGNYFYPATGETARRVWKGTKRGHCFRGGDSGGPAYTVRSDSGIIAKGILSGATGFGGSDAYAGALDAPCENVFTDIWDAYYSLPGVLTLWW